MAKGKGGAPEGNRNALRHGLRSSTLPRGCEYITRFINVLRRQLEDAVTAQRGKVTLGEALIIQTMCRLETEAQLSARWIQKTKDLTPSDAVRFQSKVTESSIRRDARFEKLGLLSAAKADGWDVLDE
jgi:uncharacterized protein YjcR